MANQMLKIALPEIDWEVDLIVMFNITAQAGCHTQVIQSIRIDLPTTAIHYKRLSDGQKASEIKKLWHPNPWAYDSAENRSVNEALSTKVKIALKDIEWDTVKDQVFETVFNVAQEQKTSTYFFSDVVNAASKAKKIAKYDPNIKEVAFKNMPHNSLTCGFVKWLIDNEHGHITSSPMTINNNHLHKAHFSVVQSWIWLPPRVVAVRGSGKRYGEKRIQDIEEFERWCGKKAGVAPGAVEEWLWNAA